MLYLRHFILLFQFIYLHLLPRKRYYLDSAGSASGFSLFNVVKEAKPGSKVGSSAKDAAEDAKAKEVGNYNLDLPS